MDAVEPTNNAAERELRPAVIVRKTNGCNRSERGADMHAILASLIRTCDKQGRDFITETKQLLQAAKQAVVDLCASDAGPPALPAGPLIITALVPAPVALAARPSSHR